MEKDALEVNSSALPMQTVLIDVTN